jgi:hypothetical protein
MHSQTEEIIRNAMAGMTSGPAPLLPAIKFYAQQHGQKLANLDSVIKNRIASGANDEVRKLFNLYLGRWDWEQEVPWANGTAASTQLRRARIYDLMCISKELRKVLDEHVRPYEGAKAVIIDDPESVRGWYDFTFRKKHCFYWNRLREFFSNVRKLDSVDSNAINAIESAADRIVERLGDPASSDIFKARGLVVGYVQSGKTTNFTAVIAKAIDAGYRLIIVLSGTTNLLRNQTQRRLDMEMVGRENILRGAAEADATYDYSEDVAWPDGFISYGAQPSHLGAVDIHRLTGLQDFKHQDAGLKPLDFDFEKRNRRLPLFDRENLDHSGARIAVVKKQKERLSALVRELKAVGKARCAEIPTLIIDDESDQASVNTINPARKNKADPTRTAINERIVNILNLLPRAQYLGYTATPFANVFINPNDPEDLYPKDFIVSLERPAGYMGARDFIDFDVPVENSLSNTEARIRDILQQDPQEFRLQEAMDAFVLTGAIKKFREKKDKAEFRHHTMLFHHSVRKDDQKEVVEKLRRMWQDAGYGSPGKAMRRLEKLLQDDYRKVWQDRGRSVGLSFPRNLSDLKPFLGAALDEIRRGTSPVLMVNSEADADVPDFDGRPGVWKIIVGGAKLSRGYTIEGLTISYFRRPAKMQDTLMQMGRWFGYRRGYPDLVRLYIGRNEPVGKATLDLYRAFEAMCRDEEDFRAELAMYEGKDGITPKQVPALVFNSYPSLRPTAKNRMFHARIRWAAFTYREPTTQATGKGRNENAELFSNALSKVKLEIGKVKARDGRSAAFDAKWSTLSNEAVLTILSKIRWQKSGNPIAAQIGYLQRNDVPIDQWILVAPQVTGSQAGSWKSRAGELNCIARKKDDPYDRFGVFSSPEHLAFAKWLVGDDSHSFESPVKQQKRTGVLLFYPTRELLPGGRVATGVPVMGFGLALPNTGSQGRRIAYSV